MRVQWARSYWGRTQDLIVNGTGMMMVVVILKHPGTIVWLRKMLKLSVQTSASWSAQFLSIQPGIGSGSAAVCGLTSAFHGELGGSWDGLLAHCSVLWTVCRNHSVHLGVRLHHNRLESECFYLQGISFGAVSYIAQNTECRAKIHKQCGCRCESCPDAAVFSAKINLWHSL